jgi:putative transcriptional regulator
VSCVDSLRGKLLIASPTLGDGNFSRTVVLVAAHDANGALGFVLNRPSDLVVGQAVERLAPVCEAFDRVYVGGPVEPAAVIVLAEFEDRTLAAVLIDGDLGLPNIEVSAETLAGGVRRARCFAGHSGWGPGQLDAELAAEAWIVETLDAEDPWTAGGHELWSGVLERKGGEYALIARMPVDPSVN